MARVQGDPHDNVSGREPQGTLLPPHEEWRDAAAKRGLGAWRLEFAESQAYYSGG